MKDPFEIACICILLLTKKVEDATVLAAVSNIIATLTTINMLSRFILAFTIILRSVVVALCCHLSTFTEVKMAAVALARRLPRLTGVSAVRHCSGFVALSFIL